MSTNIALFLVRIRCLLCSNTYAAAEVAATLQSAFVYDPLDYAPAALYAAHS